MPYAPRIDAGAIISQPARIRMQHTVQFFDALESLGETLARFVHDAVDAGRTVLLVTRPTSVTAAERALADRGVILQQLIDSGRVVVRDAATTLQSIAGPREPTADRFEATIGALVGQLIAESPAGVSIYGEMVDILASEGNFEAAEALEELWNGARGMGSVRLLCGYAAAHFAANADARLRIHRICALHAQVHQDPGDLLANWLLSPVQL